MSASTPSGTRPDDAPPAARRSQPGWRDPRVAIGLALVALSVVVGARVVGAADDTVGIWAVSDAMDSGQTISVDDLVRRQVRFADREVADRYLPASAEVPDDAALSRALGAGELLPRDALTKRSLVGLVEVPMSVAAGSLPPGLRVGATVDVWLVPTDTGTSGDENTRARRHLENAMVLDVGKEAGEFSVSGERQLLVGVSADAERQVATFLGALAGHRVVITRQN